MCTVGGRIGWIGTRSGTARRPDIADPTTMLYLTFIDDDVNDNEFDDEEEDVKEKKVVKKEIS